MEAICQEGYLYCLHSDNYDVNFFKVGFTTDLNGRFSSYKTALLNPKFIMTCPALKDGQKPFIQKFNETCGKVTHPKLREQAVHAILNKYRVNHKHEFFRCTIEQVQRAFDHVQHMAPEDLMLVVQRGEAAIADKRDDRLQQRVHELEAALSEANKMLQVVSSQEKGALANERNMWKAKYFDKRKELEQYKELTQTVARNEADMKLASDFAELQGRFDDLHKKYKAALEKIEDLETPPVVAAPVVAAPVVAAPPVVAVPAPRPQTPPTKYRASFGIFYERHRKALPSCSDIDDELEASVKETKTKFSLSSFKAYTAPSGSNRKIWFEDFVFHCPTDADAKTLFKGVQTAMMKAAVKNDKCDANFSFVEVLLEKKVGGSYKTV